jgi:replication-associated recombination protein RarA
MEDMEILRRAYEREHDTRDRRPPHLRSWEYYTIGASRNDIRRLMDEGLIVIAVKTSGLTKYKLSEKGRDFVWATTMEREFAKIPAATVLESMDLVVGFDDIKEALAKAIESRRRINFLLEGPPACAKSLILEGIRSAVPDAYIAFGSRTSASGLSEALFEYQPSVLLMDEADKMHNDCFSVLLGLMESGEILETKSRKTRGIKLETMVIGACNSTVKMPQEFLSRFALHVLFPKYSREEFIEVCQGFLTRAENCPPEIAALIGQMVFDYGLGDVRKARGAWQLMTEPTEEEVLRVIHLMRKYSPSSQKEKAQTASKSRLPGL